MEKQDTDEYIILSRSEKSILVDILRWYKSEYEIEDEEDVDAAIGSLEDRMVLDISLVNCDSLVNVVITDYTRELQPYIAEMEDAESVMKFYRERLSSITEKIRVHPSTR